MNCPNCSKKINQITKKQYFCKHCYYKIEMSKKYMYVYLINEDGNRIVIDRKLLINS